jgi:hypothetical protein
MSEAIKILLEERWDIRLKHVLGSGRDGDVYSTDRSTAVKIFTVGESYSREVRAYERLSKLGIDQVRGHEVPEFYRAEREFMAIEMTVVSPPFLLDFASAYLVAEAPDFPEEVWDEWRREKSGAFGDRWEEVELILAEFQRVSGMVLLDVNPGNVRFENA